METRMRAHESGDAGLRRRFVHGCCFAHTHAIKGLRKATFRSSPRARTHAASTNTQHKQTHRDTPPTSLTHTGKITKHVISVMGRHGLFVNAEQDLVKRGARNM